MGEEQYHGAKASYLPKNESTISFPKDRTALLVIDPVNDFLSEGGAGWELSKNSVKLHNVVEHLKQLMEGARKHGIPVILAPMAYTEDDYAVEQLQRRSGINRIMFERKMFLAGSWGADFHPDLKPQAGDIILEPHKSCDVFTTDLPEHLEKKGITHLVIAGMAADLCCESTARHAMETGYDVTFISDAIGASSIPAYEASIMLSYPLIGNAVLETEEFLSALANGSDEVQVKEGDNVLGSDRGDIGTVKKIVRNSDGTGHMLVPMGLIFKNDLYIPLDAVVKKIGDDVFINVPKIVVETMPWGEKPTVKAQQEKQGPSAGTVDHLYGTVEPTAQFR